MKKLISKRLVIIEFLIIAALTFCFINKVLASSASVAISTKQATQGEKVKVEINITSDVGMGECNFYIQYDPEIIEVSQTQSDNSLMYYGGGGQIHIQYAVSNAKSAKIAIDFDAKKPGTSAIQYMTLSDEEGILEYDSMEWVKDSNISKIAGSVTVKAPYVASKNNNLSSLKVVATRADGSTYTLPFSPEFKKGTTAYTAEAQEGTTKLVVTAKAEDSKAKVKVDGATLKDGKNTTTITVTAENGSTKKYTITTNVPITTTLPPEPIIVEIDGTDKHIKDVTETTALPEGFETVEYDYKGEKVVAAKGLSKNLVVMYITDAQGANGKLYIYEETTDTFFPMSNIQVTNKLYTIVRHPEDLVLPEGYEKTDVTVGNQTFTGWQNVDLEGIYLVYAMNWNGEEGLYYYEPVEGQMVKYFEMSVDAGVAFDEYNQLVVDNQKLKDEIEKIKKDNAKDVEEKTSLYKYIAIGCIVMSVIYLGVIILLVAKNRKKKDDTEGDITDNTENDVENTFNNDCENVDNTDNVDNEEKTDDVDGAMEAALAAGVAEALVEDEQLAEEPAMVEEPEAVEEETVEEENVVEETVLEEDFLQEFAEEIQPDIDMEDAIVASVVLAMESENLQTEEDTQAEDGAQIEDEVQIEDEAQATDETLIEEDSLETKEEPQKDENLEIEEESQIEEPQIEETIVEEETMNSINAENMDKKKKVENIMNDDSTSIHADDLDLVIDELFDDLFGE